MKRNLELNYRKQLNIQLESGLISSHEYRKELKWINKLKEIRKPNRN